MCWQTIYRSPILDANDLELENPEEQCYQEKCSVPNAEK